MPPIPETPNAPRVLALSVRPQPEREYIVSRKDDGTYDAEEKIYKVSPRIVRVEGQREGSLQQSGIKAGAPSAAMVEFVRALSYDVDFQRELKQGQKFTVLLEQLVTSDGKVTHPGRLLAGELRLMKRTVVVRARVNVREEIRDGDGRLHGFELDFELSERCFNDHTRERRGLQGDERDE